ETVLAAAIALFSTAPLVFVQAPLQIGEHAFELFFELVARAALLEIEVDLFFARAVEDDAALLGGQLGPLRVHINLLVIANRLEDLLKEGRVSLFPWIDCALAQRQLLIGDDQIGIEKQLGTDAVAGRARAVRVVE